MKGFACAFQGLVGRDAETKTTSAGRRFLKLAVAVGEDDAREWIDVTAWSDHLVDLAPSLGKGVEVYVEGALKFYRWQGQDGPRITAQVAATQIQPMGLIGQKRPKAPAKGRGKTKAAGVDSQAPVQFADGTDAGRGDEMPF